MNTRHAVKFNLEREAKLWFRKFVEAIDVDEYYQLKVLKLGNVPFAPRLASAIYDPKIFDVMKSAKAARFAGIDGWLRMMWQGSELPRWVREAIAVAVSTTNNCSY